MVSDRKHKRNILVLAYFNLSIFLRQIAASARKSKYQWHTILHLIAQWKLAEYTSNLKGSDTRTENIVQFIWTASQQPYLECMFSIANAMTNGYMANKL